MPRGVYNRKKRKKNLKLVVAHKPTLLLKPEIVEAISAGLARRLPSDVVPFVTEAGDIRLFQLWRNPFTGHWRARLMASAEVDAALGAPRPGGKKKAPVKRQKGAKEKADASVALAKAS